MWNIWKLSEEDEEEEEEEEDDDDDDDDDCCSIIDVASQIFQQTVSSIKSTKLALFPFWCCASSSPSPH